MPITPYNTGKVKIGCHYVPPQQDYNTQESEFWQGVFLGDRADLGGEFWRWVFVVAVGFVAGYFLFR